jgi:hypothetical protein
MPPPWWWEMDKKPFFFGTLGSMVKTQETWPHYMHDLAEKKKWSFKKVLSHDAWISKINMDVNLSMDHIR